MLFRILADVLRGNSVSAMPQFKVIKVERVLLTRAKTPLEPNKHLERLNVLFLECFSAKDDPVFNPVRRDLLIRNQNTLK